MSKRRIFEIYLNVIEWGNGVFGAEAAARYYYKTSAASLGRGAGRQARGHGAQSALLRQPPQCQGTDAKNHDYSGSHADGGSALSAVFAI